MKVLGLIPTRMGSIRLPAKALLPISGIPLVIHTYKRACLSKLINKIMICTDSKKNIFVFSRKLKDKKNIADVLPITNLMKKDKILKVSKLGRGEITCVTSHDFFKYIKKKYKKNNFVLTESHRYQKLKK